MVEEDWLTVVILWNPLPPPDPFAFDFWLIELLLFNNSPFVFSIFVKVFSILALEEMVGEVSLSRESLRTRASASILMNDIFLYCIPRAGGLGATKSINWPHRDQKSVNMTQYMYS